MAVLVGIYGRTEPEYEGCVLDTYEVNGAYDSDWYATCWDEGKREIVTVNYDTTRCGGGGWAEVDATEEVLRKVYRVCKANEKKSFDEFANREQAKVFAKGDMVRVIKGRKVPKGTECEVFWVGKRFNSYSCRYENRVGVVVNGERVFLAAENVEKADWQSCLLTGRRRKEAIRRRAVSAMPIRYRKYFE